MKINIKNRNENQNQNENCKIKILIKKWTLKIKKKKRKKTSLKIKIRQQIKKLCYRICWLSIELTLTNSRVLEENSAFTSFSFFATSSTSNTRRTKLLKQLQIENLRGQPTTYIHTHTQKAISYKCWRVVQQVWIKQQFNQRICETSIAGLH